MAQRNPKLMRPVAPPSDTVKDCYEVKNDESNHKRRQKSAHTILTQLEAKLFPVSLQENGFKAIIGLTKPESSQVGWSSHKGSKVRLSVCRFMLRENDLHCCQPNASNHRGR